MINTIKGITVNLGGFEAKFIFPSNKKTFKKTTHGPLHFHFDSEVHFVLSGNFTLITDGKEYTLDKDSICVIPKGISHDAIYTQGDGSNFNMLVSLRPLPSKTKQDNMLRGKAQVWQSATDIQVFENSTKICDYIRDFVSVQGKNEYINQSIMVLVLFALTEQLEKIYPCRSEVAKACEITYDGSFFDAQLENYFMTHYRDRLSREEVASKIGISPAQLSRIIKKNYGMSYIDLITALRMNEAKKLIKQKISLAEIAKSLGYTTYNGFVAAFRRYYGMAPEKMKKGEKI